MLILYKQESTLHDIIILLISLIFRNYIPSHWHIPLIDFITYLVKKRNYIICNVLLRILEIFPLA